MVFSRTAAAMSAMGRRRPLLFGMGVSALKTSGSDIMAQKYFEGRQEIDFRRNFVFFTWGLLYLGGVQYFIYVRLFTRHLFPNAARFVAKPWREKLADTPGQITVLKQVFLDQFVHHPFVLFPAFYQVKEFIEGGTPAEAFRKFRKNWAEDLKLCWAVWVPAFLVNFSVCPTWMRVPFVAAVSFGFTIALSCLRGAPEETAEKTLVSQEE
eukprot:TRINITY_DN38255_c0_g1_i1.p1 TRINITY_DN38255_c0_g1~~TRINITY_DN38255_c0_g1_i1.p1  ORF type:complete len:210 (-),score=40.91 TRINITY_DN38255_c0_g1_i1:44-673(-)